MSIILGQINTLVGDLKGNSDKVSNVLKHKTPTDLIIFPELTISGYPPQDLLEFPWFVDKCLTAVNDLARKHSDRSFLVGLPYRSGDRLYNAAAFCSEGLIKDLFFKTLLPNYDVFYERRYFSSNYKDKPNVLVWNGMRLLIAICEDIWFDDKRYDWDPVENADKYKVDGIINLSASPYYKGKTYDRQSVVKSVMDRTHVKFLAYCNQVGLNDQVLFDGASFFCVKDVGGYVPKGPFRDNEPVFQYAPSFKEAELVLQLPIKEMKVTCQIVEERRALGQTGAMFSNVGVHFPKGSGNPLEETKNGIVLGIRDYFRKSGRKPVAVIGLSGGIDSALVACLAAEALGPDNVYGYTMPTEFSTAGSINNSFLIAKNLGIHCEEITIGEVHDSIRGKLGYKKDFQEGSLTDQNLQPRIRMIMLMAKSCVSGGLVLGTSNKSELQMSYGTLYGDMASGLCVTGDLMKTEVYEMAEKVYKDKIPHDTLYQPPSAELAHNQKDTDSLPAYSELDPKLIKFLENKEQIEDELMHKIAIAQFKREQFPIIIKVSKKAFGSGWRFPVLQGFF